MTGFAPSVRKYQFILIPIALGFLLPSLLMPWVTINFLGVTGLTPLDLFQGSYKMSSNVTSSEDTAAASREPPELVFLDLVSSYNVAWLYSVWMLAYLGSIIVMIISAMLKQWRVQTALLGGALAIVAATVWLFSIEEMKINFAAQASMTGGLIGGEFKGNERALIDTIVRMGLGPYIAIAAGAAGILSYPIQHYFKKSRDDDSPPLQKKFQQT